MALIAKDVKASKHGLKTALLLTQDNSRINATFREGCTAAFEPSSMEESSTRLTADLRGNDAFISFFESIDDKVVTLLVAESSTFFGKTLGYEDVNKLYVPCVKRKGDYAPMVRTKIRLEGSNATRVWNAAGEPRKPPPSWRGVSIAVKVVVSHVWMSKASAGVTVFLEDVQVLEDVSRSPFEKYLAIGKADVGCNV